MKNNWQTKKLREVLSLEYGKGLTEKVRVNGSVPVYGSNGAVGTHNTMLVHGPGIVVGRKGSIGEVVWSDSDFWPIDTTYYIQLLQNDKLRYIYYLLQTLKLKSLNKASGVPGLNREDVYKITVSLPSLDVQKQIVEKLDAIRKLQGINQKEIEKVEELFNSYLARGDKLNEGIQIKKLGELVDVITKGTTPTTYGHSFTKDGIPFLRVENINNNIVNPLSTTHHIDKATNTLLNRSRTRTHDVLITIAGTIGRVGYIPKNIPEMNMNQAVAIIRAKPDLLNFLYLFYLLQTKELQRQMTAARVVGTITNISLTTLKNFDISCPSIDEQIKIADRLDHLMTYKKLLLQKLTSTTTLFESMLNKLLNLNCSSNY